MLSISSMLFARHYEKQCRENLRSALKIVREFLDERHVADKRFLEKMKGASAVGEGNREERDQALVKDLASQEIVCVQEGSVLRQPELVDLAKLVDLAWMNWLASPGIALMEHYGIILNAVRRGE
jgi:hypothetical protein